MKSQPYSTIPNDRGEYKIYKTEAEWREVLSPLQFKILRRGATEQPYTGDYCGHSEPGMYYSAASGQPLFVSEVKFESGCGWPSFFAPILQESILYRTDLAHGMVRTEIIDSSSGSHLGHVFTDGPPPTGLRYCVNSAAMLFVGVNQKLPAIVEKYMNEFASEAERKIVKEFISNALC